LIKNLSSFKWILIFTFSFLVPVETHIQSIYGQVTSNTSYEPLVGVNITIDNTRIGTATDENGFFKFSNLNFNNCDLTFSMIGYVDYQKTISTHLKEPLKITLIQDRIDMSTIVVTGTKTERYLKDVPVTTQVIKNENIQESGAINLSEVLGDVTGLSVVENQFGYGVELSGFDSDHVLIMIDGMKLIGRTNGQLDISQIPVEEIKRIEIVKGASSALYGSEAMGGVVNIITYEPTTEFNTKISANIGSFGKANSNISIYGGLFGWNTKLNFNSQFYGGNNIYSESLWENGSEYQKYNMGLQLRRNTLSFGDFKFNINQFWEKQNNSLDFFEDVTHNSRLSLQFEHQIDLFDIQFTSSLEHSDYNHLFEQFVVSSGYKRKNDLTIDQLDKITFAGSKDIDMHTINGGFGHELESIDSDRILGNYQASESTHYYLQDEYKVNSKIILLSGFRTDIHSIYGTYISPKISLMIKPELFSRIRISYGQGFRAPTFKELYLDFTVFDIGYRIIGDQDLYPERSKSINLDFERWHTDRYHGRLNIFFNQIDNLIDYAYMGTDQESGLELWQTANIRQAKTHGLDIDLTYFFIKNIELTAGYSYLNTWDVDNESPINLKSKHKANSKLRFKFNNNINMNLRFQYIGERYYGEESIIDNELVENWLDHYTLIHSSFSMKIWESLQVKMGVNNITDVKDPIWGPMPGREWFLGFEYSLINKKEI
jgi:outer membrane receptor for ferrienterochelin and colicins